MYDTTRLAIEDLRNTLIILGASAALDQLGALCRDLGGEVDGVGDVAWHREATHCELAAGRLRALHRSCDTVVVVAAEQSIERQKKAALFPQRQSLLVGSR
jgi:hypothetical protein